MFSSKTEKKKSKKIQATQKLLDTTREKTLKKKNIKKEIEKRKIRKKVKHQQ